MSSLSPGGLVALGVIVGLVSTCVQSVGLTLQRKSHILEDEKEEHLPKRAPYRRRRWQIGMLLFLLSNIVGSSIQITTLPLPLLSTLQASGLVFNAVLASLLLHEPFTRRTLLGTVLVAAGAVLISFFSALPEPSHSLDQLLALLVVPGFLIWMSLTLFLALVITILSFALAHFLSPQRRAAPRIRLLRGMSYGLISGILSAHALLLAKSAVELLVRTIVDKRNQFNRPEAWGLLLLFLFLALTQLYYLHHGLKLVSTSILYPFVFCIYNIIAILDGLIYFRQTDRLPPLHGGLIALGTIVLLTGVLALSWRLSDETASSDEDAEFESRIKADIPHSALTPGLGLVNEDHDVHTPLKRFFESPTRERYRDDPEEETTDVPALIDTEHDPAEEDDITALTRRHTTQNAASGTVRGKSTLRSRRSSVATADKAHERRRRSTIKEVQAVWDELRDERNWFPPSPPNKSSTLSQVSRYRDDPGASHEIGPTGDDSGSKRKRPKSATGAGKRVDFSPALIRNKSDPSADSAGDDTMKKGKGKRARPTSLPLGSELIAAAGADEDQRYTDSPDDDKSRIADPAEESRPRIHSSPRSAGGSPSIGSGGGPGSNGEESKKNWKGSVKLDWWGRRKG